MREKGLLFEKIKLVFSMLVFGTIGLLVREIPLSSSIIAMIRGLIAFVFLVIFSFISGKKISFKAIKSNLFYLLLSGAFIGFNWIFLFEAYNYTSIATATLCYYMAPVFVIILSPFILKEKLSVKKIICVAVSLTGMLLVSGVVKTGIKSISELKGVFFGIAAAVLYSGVSLMNKKISDISSNDRTLVQLGTAGIVVAPYAVITQHGDSVDITLKTVVLLLIIGIFYTGFCYALYFTSVKALPAQTSAVLSYIDPITAVLLSALYLRESLDFLTAAGAVLILGSTIISEINITHKRRFS